MSVYGESDRLWRVIFGPSPVAEDVTRWTNQGFVFSPKYPFVLEQSQGGPCGVLAPIQAFLVDELVFNTSVVSDLKGLLTLSSAHLTTVLTSLLRDILRRASPAGQPAVVLKLSSATTSQFDTIEHVDPSVMSALDLLASVVASRGIDRMVSDMDDPETPLIGRFGHCSQEVLNLLLFGRATSNVFDGEQDLDDGVLVLHGVPDDVTVRVGLLSELESLRYVTVGDRLKNPQLPAWIIGSPSHYTLLFSFDATACQRSDDERGLTAIVKKFNAFALDQGLALAVNLPSIIASLGLHESVVNEEATKAIVHEGVVILDDFINWAKRRGLVPMGGATVGQKPLQFIFVNGQTPPEIFHVEVRPGVVSEPVPDTMDVGGSLRAILLTRWPASTISIKNVML